MRMKLIAVLAGVAVAASTGQIALANNAGGNSANKRAMQIDGTIASTDGDADPLTAGPVVINVTKANGNARRALAGATTATFAVGDSTKYYGAASSFADLAAGDAVRIDARNSETGFVAKKVKEKRAAG